MPGVGGCAFPCAPDASPTHEPAQWSPEALTTIVVYQASDASITFLPSGFTNVRADHFLSDGRHIVADIGKARFRLWLRVGAPGQDPNFLIPAGPDQASRAEATSRFLRALEVHRRLPQACGPTAYARHRLVQFLALLDARTGGCSSRDIAQLLVFPRTLLPNGAAWKGSGERRHTLRLVAKAMNLTRGGYRSLPGFIKPV